MARTKTSKRWLAEHFADPYVKRAQLEGYRSRAAYKLMEINDKDKIIKQGMTVVDLGAAPGGWSQVAARLVGHKGRVIALDILPMDALAGVEFIQGDFGEDSVLQQLMALIQDTPIDVVVSDIAPNMSGIPAVDHPRVMYLSELVDDFAKQVLKPGGVAVMKVFQGEGFDAFLQNLRKHFSSVQVRKPQSSRSRSAEVYLVAKGFKKSL